MSNLDRIARALEQKWQAKRRIETSTKHDRIVKRLLAALSCGDLTDRDLHSLVRCNAHDLAAAKQELLASGKVVQVGNIVRLVQS